MELVERDSVGIWWYNRLQRPRVDLNSFKDPYLLELQSYYLSLQREFWVLDLTADLEIPVFAAISRCTKGAEKIAAGYGAHFDAQIALLRAVTEMNQFLIRIEGQEANKAPQELLPWLTNATVENKPYLVPALEATPKIYADYLSNTGDDRLLSIK